MTAPQYVLEMRSISKAFPGVQALGGVELLVKPGEVHALLGENGAGKSTLIKVLAGVYQPDSGEVRVGGKAVSFRHPTEAHKAGISFIHQELNLVPRMSGYENVILGQRYPRTPFGTIAWKELRRKVDAIASDLGLTFSLNAAVGTLPTAHQAMIAISRALLQECRVIVMDEPTASLTDQEVETLFRVIRSLQARGIAVVYVSHRLEEIFQIADTMTVLRDGRHVATRPLAGATMEGLIQLITGREVSLVYEKQPTEIGEPLLSVRNLHGRGVHGISFDLRAGEILGVAGLVGSGRTELARAIFGAEPPTAGEVRVNGKLLRLRSPQDAIRNGIALIPEERRSQGIFRNRSVAENMTIATLPSLRVWKGIGIINSRREQTEAAKQILALSIKTPGPEYPIRLLSGGNQQKAILARWMRSDAKVLIFDEPTRGIDVGAKSEIYRLINELAREGKAILFISSELPEILALSDRVIVLRERRMVAELDRSELSQERILTHYFGGEGSTVGADPSTSRRTAEG